MESNTPYIVSARKYRPQSFKTIVGQEHVTNTLQNSILTHQIAQAYLFFGPRGVGKTTCARVFAKTINCLNLQSDGEACNNCVSCNAFNSNTSLNIYELDAASNNSVEDIRQLIDQVRYPPQIGKYKVYIIDEVHMLSTAAFNAFLKTLEEPPPYVKFILATTEKNKVIPTVLSRCQVFNFNRIKTEDIARYLEKIAVKENHRFEPEALRIIAQKADGGLRDACSIYDQMVAFTEGNITTQAVIENLHVLDYDYYFQLTDSFLNQNYPEILLLLDKILNKGFDPQNVLVGLIDHLRYLLLAKDPQTLSLLDVSDNTKSTILMQSKKCSERFLLNALSILNKADVSYRSSRHQRLHLEIHLLQIANIQQTLSEAEKKSPVDAISSVQSPLSGENGMHSLNKKTSDKPILNPRVIPTASLKEIEKIISSKQPSIQENVTAKKEIKSDTSVNLQKDKNVSVPQNSIENESISISEDNNIVRELPEEYISSQSLENNEKIIAPPSRNEKTSESSIPHVLHTTEEKYQELLLKNPLLEELRIKLNLQFK